MKLLARAAAVLIAVASIEAYMLTTADQATQPSPIRVACVGDSITRGTEYTLDLWHKLGANYVVGDFGVGGTTVWDDSGSGYMNTTAFELAKQFQPDIVVIMLGTNDANPTLNETKAMFVSDYLELVSGFQSLASKPEMYIVLPPPIFENSVGLSEETLVQRVIPGIKEVAGQLDLPLIDAHTPLLGNADFFVDGVHPNVKGAKAIANVVYEVLSKQ